MNTTEVKTDDVKFELGKIRLPAINEYDRWLVYARGGGLEANKQIDFDPGMTKQEKDFRIFQKQTHCMVDIMAKLLEEK